MKSGLMTSSVRPSISGEVERSALLTLAELRSVMDAEVVADFHAVGKPPADEEPGDSHVGES